MKDENRNYRKDDEKPKNDFIGLVLIIVGFVCLGVLFYFIQPKTSNTEETVSIHQYNALQHRMEYLVMVNHVKSQILYEFVVNNEVDTAFIESLSNHVTLPLINNEKVNMDDIIDKELLSFQLDSICADWYESIPFMFIDAEHDSTWVQNSESYQSTMALVNELRNK